MIPFNKPYLTGHELEYIKDALKNLNLSGNGPFSQKSQKLLEQLIPNTHALLTHSCTAALEMAALIANISPHDEIIMPSFTFVSTANAFILAGGTPVFVDVDKNTLNISATQIKEAINKKTKAICVVHYAGVSCDMDPIMEIAEENNLIVIEDAAQGLLSRYKGRSVGSLGHISCFSFHETKNIISGEGGAILLKDENNFLRAEIIREKGTDRSKFLRGLIDKYTWVDKGSSYLPSDFIGAFLLAQLEQAQHITDKRLEIWNYYHENLKTLEDKGHLRRPFIPEACEHNAHLYYLIVKNQDQRNQLINFLKEKEISAPFHYVPLHSSPFGRTHAKTCGDLSTTQDLSARLLRLPLYYDLTQSEQDKVITAIHSFFL